MPSGSGVGTPVSSSSSYQDNSPFGVVWLYDDSAGAYVNNSVESEIPSGTAFELIAQTADKAYWGFSRKFKGVIIDVSTAGSYGARTWEYSDDASDPTSWTRFVPWVDYTFTSDKYLLFRPPKDWQMVSFSTNGPHSTISPPDTAARYWIRLSVASVTTAATINEVQLIPENTYTTAADVNDFLQFKTDFSSTTIPSLLQVEKMIEEAESRIDTRTRRSWRWNRSGSYGAGSDNEYEYKDYNHYGLLLDHPDIIKVYALHLWNGADWQTLTEGRDNDFFFQPDEGMLFISRLYIPPIAYGLSGRFYHWEYGEYKRAFRVSYSWGQDWRTSPSFHQVKETAEMMVARNIITNNDFSKLVTRGVDNIPFAEKVRIWQEKIEENLEELSALIIA